MKDILYITFVDFDNLSSASSLRPYEIYKAFLNNGYKVTLLTGLQNRMGERWRNAFDFLRKIRKKQFDFCYIELPSGPIFNLCDHLLMMYIKSRKIPVGIFYRDAYWKYPSWNTMNRFKRFIIKTMNQFDLFIFRHTCKIVYFPSDTMADLFSLHRKLSLPPACRNDLFIDDTTLKKKVIYVGAASKKYGIDMLLEAFSMLNENRNDLIYLNLVCRETNEYVKPYMNEPWLKIYTGYSGEKLKDIYLDSDFAVIPRKREEYTDFAVPVKLYEYISYGLPIISTNCIETAKVINSYNIGLCCDDNAQALKQSVEEMYDNYTQKIDLYKNNIKKAISENLWSTRVDYIEKTLKEN